ncbi:hypothetical protein ACIGW0_31455 [Streptomyces bikiniensis]|uniref:Uncharacterized protein n=1 Tax=Streptomyces bikiniensis TaxID=1896 RepID=A0ABW8D1Y8_STRBI
MSECPPGVHSIFDPCPGNCTAPLDEFDDLFDELWSMEYRITGDKPKAMEFARTFLARHAHVLAEWIREEFTDAHEAAQEVLSGTEAMLAADLIDPGVEA